jgi:prophage regulatory protein
MRLIRSPELRAMTGLSRSTIYSLSAQNLFPQPRRIGHRAVAWLESEIVDWMQGRPDAASTRRSTRALHDKTRNRSRAT